MNEQLVVKNFGPIKDATVDFKRVTVFIGPTGGGKSTLAKLAAVFREEILQKTGSEQERLARYSSVLDHYSLNNFPREGNYVKWSGNRGSITASASTIVVDGWNNEGTFSPGDLLIKIMQNTWDEYGDSAYSSDKQRLIAERVRRELSTDESYQAFEKQLLKNPQTVYVPAERIITSTVSAFLANLTIQDIALPRPLLEFCSFFAEAREKLASKYFSVDFFSGISYRFHHGRDEVMLGDGKSISLNETASGIQTALPMILVAIASIAKPWAISLVVEEPELNLFPNKQSGITNFLVATTKGNNRDLTITTHSPYILSHFNLLLYAYQVAEQYPDRADEVAELVPRESWINPKEFACYQVENGGVTSLVNEELGLIDDNGLDGLSGDAADAFDNLIRLSKGVTLR